MTRFFNLIAAIIGGLLLWAAWPTSPLTFLIFIAWVPLLWIENRVQRTGKFFAISYLVFFTWNILTTWWVWNASLPGALGAFVVNSLIMCIPWALAHATKKRFGQWIGYGSLIIYWVAFEFIHHNWELSWPWLTLGNVFATKPEWIQWYEYSGASGGTVWVLLANIFAFTLIREYRSSGRSKVYYINLASFIAILVIPILLSRMIGNTERKIASAAIPDAVKNVVVVQPNVDPYTEKFTGSIESQVEKLIVLSEQQIDKNTTLVVWPETAIPVQVNEDAIKTDRRFFPIWSFLKRHPWLNLLTGIDSYKDYGSNKNASKTARYYKDGNIYYDMFNTAAQFDADTTIQLYHKAKLVPGVESLPSFLNFMSTWFEDLGGTSGTLGRDSSRKVFIPWDNHFKAAPIICYESIYGDYITEYIRRGANILTIITNDGWWGNTPGYRQHMNYARLRAVETRKWVARSANTGISCFIDPLGNVINPQPWDEAAAIKLTIPVDNRQTFFVRNGDILSRGMLAVSVVLLLILIGTSVQRWWLKRKSKQAV